MNKQPLVLTYEEWDVDHLEPGLKEDSYGGLVGTLGVEILLQESDHDYQGDSMMLLQDGSRYGYLSFGWGSCSGCDALQACDSLADYEALRDGLEGSIKWFGSLPEVVGYLRGKDWTLEFLNEELVGRFLARLPRRA